jgi:hypothetical protein
MATDIGEIKDALKAEIKFKNTLIYVLLGVAFGIGAFTGVAV